MKAESKNSLFKPPEWRDAPQEEGLLDLSEDGFTLSPLEPELEISLQSRTSGLDVLLNFLSKQKLAKQSVLLFEPTEPDIRAAIVRSGSTYIDAGRYLDGQPDLDAASCALRAHIGLTIFGPDDNIPESWPTPTLVDRRNAPFLAHQHKEDWSIQNLGRRDGLSVTKYTWISSKSKGHPKDLPSLCTSDAFSKRASKRRSQQELFLEKLSVHGKKLGFETLTQAGFLWLSIPGTGAEKLRDACATTGLSVSGFAHHPYRNRIKIGIPDDDHFEQVLDCLSKLSLKQDSKP
jgi:hypothetical protein